MISSSAIIEVGPVTKSIIYQRLFHYPREATGMGKGADGKCVEHPGKDEQCFAQEEERPGTAKRRFAQGEERPETAERCFAQEEERPETAERCFAQEEERPGTAKRCFAQEEERPGTAERCFAQEEERPETAERCFAQEEERPETAERCFAQEEERPETAERCFAQEEERPGTAKRCFAQEEERPGTAERCFAQEEERPGTAKRCFAQEEERPGMAERCFAQEEQRNGRSSNEDTSASSSVNSYPHCATTDKSRYSKNPVSYFVDNKPTTWFDSTTANLKNTDARGGHENGLMMDERNKEGTHSKTVCVIANAVDHCMKTSSSAPRAAESSSSAPRAAESSSSAPRHGDEDLRIYEDGDFRDSVPSSRFSTSSYHAEDGPKYCLSSVEYDSGQQASTADDLLLESDSHDLKCSDFLAGYCDQILHIDDAVGSLEHHPSDDAGLNQDGGEHSTPGSFEVSNNTGVGAAPIGFCDNHSNASEVAVKGARWASRSSLSTLQSEMVLSAGHLQNDLSAVRARRRCSKLPRSATDHDSAGLGEASRASLRVGKGFPLYFPHHSIKGLAESAAGVHGLEQTLSEEIIKLMTEQELVEGQSNGCYNGGDDSTGSGKKGCDNGSAPSSGQCGSVLTSGENRERRSMEKDKPARTAAKNANSRHLLCVEDHTVSLGQQEPESRQSDPVEQVDSSRARDGRLSNESTLTCPPDTIHDVQVPNAVVLENGICESVPDSTSHSISSAFLDPSSVCPLAPNICKDSHTGSETFGFPPGEHEMSSSYDQVEECVCEDTGIGSNFVCDDPESTLGAMVIEYPIFNSLARENIVFQIPLSGALDQPPNASAQDKIKSFIHIGESVKTTEANVQIGNLSAFRANINEAGASQSHFLTSDVQENLNSVYDKELTEEIQSSTLMYANVNAAISNSSLDSDPPRNSINRSEVGSCTETLPMPPTYIFDLDQEDISSGLDEITDCYSDASSCVHVAEDSLEEVAGVPSDIKNEFLQTNERALDRCYPPQLSVSENSSSDLISESEGELFYEIKSLLEAFSQGLEENMEGNRNQLDLWDQPDTSVCIGQHSPGNYSDDVHIIPPSQEISTLADAAAVDQQETDGLAEISMDISVKTLMKDYLLNETVSSEYMERDREVESERGGMLLDCSKTKPSAAPVLTQSQCKPEVDADSVEKAKDVHEDASTAIAAEQEMSTTFSMRHILTDKGWAGVGGDANITLRTCNGTEEADNCIRMAKTDEHAAIMPAYTKSTVKLGYEGDHCFMDALIKEELREISSQHPEPTQTHPGEMIVDRRKKVNLEIFQEEDQNGSTLHGSSEKEAAPARMQDTGEVEHEAWALSRRSSQMIDSSEHVLPSESRDNSMLGETIMVFCKEQNRLSIKIMNSEIQISPPDICNAEEGFPVQQRHTKVKEQRSEKNKEVLAKYVFPSPLCPIRDIPSDPTDTTQDPWFSSPDDSTYHQMQTQGKGLEKMSTDVRPDVVVLGPALANIEPSPDLCEQNTCERTSPKHTPDGDLKINESEICCLEGTLGTHEGKIVEPHVEEPLSVDDRQAPHLRKDMHAAMSRARSKPGPLSRHCAEVRNDVAVSWTEDSHSTAKKSAQDNWTAPVPIMQPCRKGQGVNNCILESAHVEEASEFSLTSEVLGQCPSCPDTEGGEEIEFNQLFFRDDFISDSYFGGNLHGKIATEELHFGEGVHRKAFRSRVMYGLVPVFSPGHVCVLKVHNAVAYGTKTTDELIQRNYKLAAQECYVQNTAREYAKMYAEEAEHLDAFGKVPEIIPIFLIHRLANHIPYATVEEELVGDFVKYSIRDGKEINFMRRDSEAGQKCCTFQHWVFQKTSGNLLVTDMQGVGMKLTDVGIATLPKGYKGFKGNCSISFIEQFKALHLCNKYCEMLGLTSLQKQKKPAAVKTKAQPNSSANSRKTGHGAKAKSKR
ncbi:alpha-protein kinase 2 [Ambystoma mexicanum]|uniref:alpha-protein kinase 2 n=1 Tax=Ambystoma mexicanum TaxID=8296 RepID=UPI0037E846E9